LSAGTFSSSERRTQPEQGKTMSALEDRPNTELLVIDARDGRDL